MLIFNFPTLSTFLVFFCCYQFFFHKYNPDPHAIQESIMGITPHYQDQIPYLPPEVWDKIFTEHLHKKEIASLAATCKQFLFITQDYTIPRIVAKKAIMKLLTLVNYEKNFFSELKFLLFINIRAKLNLGWYGPFIGNGQYSFSLLHYFLKKIHNKELEWIRKNKTTSYYFIKYFVKHYLLCNPNLQFQWRGRFDPAVNKVILYLKDNFFDHNGFLRAAFSKKYLNLNFFEKGQIIFQLDMQKKNHKTSRALLDYQVCYPCSKADKIAGFDRYCDENPEKNRSFFDSKKIYIAIINDQNCGSEAGIPEYHPIKKLKKISHKIRQLNISFGGTTPSEKNILKAKEYSNLKRLLLDGPLFGYNKPMAIDDDFIDKKSSFELTYQYRLTNFVNKKLMNCDGIHVTFRHKKCIF